MNANNKKWYVGAMNDGLFVIDAPPRPSTDDITQQPNVNVIAALGTNREAADLLVAEHNKRIDTLKDVRDLIQTVNPRLTFGSANGSVMKQAILSTVDAYIGSVTAIEAAANRAEEGDGENDGKR